MSILLLLVALVCGIFFVRGVSTAIMSYQTKSWERCVGELITWDIYNDVDSEETLLRIKAFRYKYMVSGKEYESDKVGVGFPRGGSVLSGQRVLDEVLVNAPVITVYYSPGNPQDSVLCVGIKYYHIEKVIIFGLVMIAFLGFAAAQLYLVD